jgi:hypothetical protein
LVPSWKIGDRVDFLFDQTILLSNRLWVEPTGMKNIKKYISPRDSTTLMSVHTYNNGWHVSGFVYTRRTSGTGRECVYRLDRYRRKEEGILKRVKSMRGGLAGREWGISCNYTQTDRGIYNCCIRNR